MYFIHFSDETLVEAIGSHSNFFGFKSLEEAKEEAEAILVHESKKITYTILEGLNHKIVFTKE